MGKCIARKKTPPEYGLSPCTGLAKPKIRKVLCTHGSHYGCLPVKLCPRRALVYRKPYKKILWRHGCWGRLKGGRTRSSPMGPAEHDEGGSLLILISPVYSMPGAGHEVGSLFKTDLQCLPLQRWYAYLPRSVSSLLIRLRAIV